MREFVFGTDKQFEELDGLLQITSESNSWQQRFGNPQIKCVPK